MRFIRFDVVLASYFAIFSILLFMVGVTFIPIITFLFSSIGLAPLGDICILSYLTIFYIKV